MTHTFLILALMVCIPRLSYENFSWSYLSNFCFGLGASYIAFLGVLFREFLSSVKGFIWDIAQGILVVSFMVLLCLDLCWISFRDFLGSCLGNLKGLVVIWFLGIVSFCGLFK